MIKIAESFCCYIVIADGNHLAGFVADVSELQNVTTSLRSDSFVKSIFLPDKYRLIAFLSSGNIFINDCFEDLYTFLVGP